MSPMQYLQSLFMDAMFDERDDKPAIDTLSRYLLAKKGLTPAQQLDIYRDSIFGSLCRSLGQIYPVCKRLVGDEFFDFMATSYIRKHPSVSPDLGDYGEQFSDFIGHFEAAAELDYLPDVARLEWAWHKAFHAADQDGLDIEKLAQLEPHQQQSLVFMLPPGSTLLASEYPVDAIWLANQDGNDEDQVVSLEQGAVRLLVWRQQYDMRIDSLDPQQWQLLSAINCGQTLENICISFAKLPSLDIPALLPVCVQRGWIASFDQEHTR